jgi:hypothetical protein
MLEPLSLRDLSWALNTLLELVLLFFLLRRKLYRSHGPFLIYIVAVILQSAVVAASYRYLGERSVASFNIAWSSQAVVICTRWFAVIDIAKKALEGFSSIWELAVRVLFVGTACVLIYAIGSAGNRWTLAVLTADRAEELCIAAFIVFLLIFLRYYGLPLNDLERMLAIGFVLYSCSAVINNSIYEHFRLPFAPLWNYLEMLTFIASLTLWIGAVRRYAESTEVAAEPALTPEHYLELSQKLNSRLHLLNQRLDHFFRSGDPRP